MSNDVRFNRDTWPIAAAMNGFPGVLPDGSRVQDQSVDQWAATLQQVVDTGFTEFDPSDSWLRVADLSPSRRREFMYLVKTLGLTIPAISTTRTSSVIDPVHADEYLAYNHRVIDAAAEIGAQAVLKATNVDGVYSADPKKDKSATRFERLTHSQAVEGGYKVMDATAFALARETALPIIVFSVAEPGSIGAILNGKGRGTLVAG